MMEEATEVVSDFTEPQSYAESEYSPASSVSVSIGRSVDSDGSALVAASVADIGELSNNVLWCYATSSVGPRSIQMLVVVSFAVLNQ